MLGMLVDERERKEMEYLIKRELEELILDMQDKRIDPLVRRAMKERYRILFRLFRKVAEDKECRKYILN
ncbi:hypothetical protein [Virgibacillus senegalensis]|uniref:hypothetical protein n=1 Tax=Virgibacillus senegalensis TaxID=1499679 RepID=UPI00069F883C|nr:hypothetical protein [Virgibacillus senegalensis]